MWSVRVMDMNGDLETFGDFQEHSSKLGAMKAMARAIAELEHMEIKEA
jgi:hypothetical protein